MNETKQRDACEEQPLSLCTESNPTEPDVEIVREGLRAFNRKHASADDYRRLSVFLRDELGCIHGGLSGGTYWGWLYVEIMWIEENLRGRRYGTALLRAAEQEARARGCHHAHLDTMSFQSPGFYERQGYTVFGKLEDLPRGHVRFFLSKPLGDEPDRNV